MCGGYRKELASDQGLRRVWGIFRGFSSDASVAAWGLGAFVPEVCHIKAMSGGWHPYICRHVKF